MGAGQNHSLGVRSLIEYGRNSACKYHKVLEGKWMPSGVASASLSGTLEYLKVSEKGELSVYGMGRFPITL